MCRVSRCLDNMICLWMDYSLNKHWDGIQSTACDALYSNGIQSFKGLHVDNIPCHHRGDGGEVSAGKLVVENKHVGLTAVKVTQLQLLK